MKNELDYFFHQAVALLITHTVSVYALLFYTLNGQKLQQQHSLGSPFPTMLFGKYQVVPFSYMCKFFR